MNKKGSRPKIRRGVRIWPAEVATWLLKTRSAPSITVSCFTPCHAQCMWNNWLYAPHVLRYIAIHIVREAIKRGPSSCLKCKLLSLNPLIQKSDNSRTLLLTQDWDDFKMASMATFSPGRQMMYVGQMCQTSQLKFACSQRKMCGTSFWFCFLFFLFFFLSQMENLRNIDSKLELHRWHLIVLSFYRDQLMSLRGRILRNSQHPA